MIELVLTFDRKVVNNYKFDKDSILIGRDPTCDIRIDNVGISRHHSRIEKQGNIYTLIDLESGNGTYVRGKRITRHNLNDGDEIGLWNYSLIFKSGLAPKEPVGESSKVKTAPKLDLDMTIAVDARQLDLKQRERATALAGYLLFAHPKRGEQTYSLTKTTTFFGGDKNCEFLLKGWFIQPRHAMIVRDETGFRLINFANHKRGTVNGKSVDDHRLRDGEEIKIANLSFKYFNGMPPIK